MFEVPLTHLAPQTAWASILSSIDDPTIGFVILMGAMLLCALLLLGRRPPLAAEPERGRRPVDPSKVVPRTRVRPH